VHGGTERSDYEREHLADCDLPDPGRVGHEAGEGEERDDETGPDNGAEPADGLAADARGHAAPDALVEVEHDHDGDDESRAGLVQGCVRGSCLLGGSRGGMRGEQEAGIRGGHVPEG
jgi:hypothetical protein